MFACRIVAMCDRTARCTIKERVEQASMLPKVISYRLKSGQFYANRPVQIVRAKDFRPRITVLPMRVVFAIMRKISSDNRIPWESLS
jgi:hypothetical protein